MAVLRVSAMASRVVRSLVRLQDHNMTNHHIAEQESDDCIKMQEAPKAHLSNKSSRPGHGCPLSGQHPDHDQPIANDGQDGIEIVQEARVEGLSP